MSITEIPLVPPKIISNGNIKKYVLIAYKTLAESSFSQEEIELMAKTYAEINSAYFEGRPIKKKDHAEGIELWRAYGDSFISKYIDSMLSSNGKSRK